MAGVIIPGSSGAPVDPDAERSSGRECPKCKGRNFTGRNVGGTILFKCQIKGCGGEWAGGMGQFNPAGVKPNLPPPRHVPEVRFNLEKRDPEHPNMFEEIRRSVDTRPDFRRGALVPSQEDEEI